LSRSEKKILHVDDNDYYGGAEAAFSLQEAEDWAKRVNESGVHSAAPFTSASVSKPETAESDSAPKLSFSRAYSLELSPQVLYTRSSLLQYLVSSKVFRQLEFLAVGNWWVFSPSDHTTAAAPNFTPGSPEHGTLLKVPSGREDVFQDQAIDFKAKRALMKFLRFIQEYEEQPEVWEEHRDMPFPAFLSSQFKVPVVLHAPLLALTLSTASADQTTTGYALPRIARHLRSIGVYGPGFGAVLPKWGGMSEIVQVACRSCAVGGGVYVLGKGVSDLAHQDTTSPAADGRTTLHLKDGEAVTTQWVVRQEVQAEQGRKCCRSITIVSSPLEPLFPTLAEGAPSPASSVVVFPSGSLSLDGHTDMDLPPVHVFVHSSDTGECPVGQSKYTSPSHPLPSLMMNLLYEYLSTLSEQH
jgi:RAB protein geranylgeranyltransferase component A